MVPEHRRGISAGHGAVFQHNISFVAAVAAFNGNGFSLRQSSQDRSLLAAKGTAYVKPILVGAAAEQKILDVEVFPEHYFVHYAGHLEDAVF